MQAVFRGLPRRLPLALLGSTILALAGAGAASAATYTVNTTTDSATPCTGSGSCSLRGAVIAADNAGGSSTINVPAGLYKLTIASAGPNDPATGDLDIKSGASVTVMGAGSGATTLSGNTLDRLFSVQQGAALTLSGMTLRQGYPSVSSSGFQDGGAVYTDGGLTVTGDVAFQDNQAPDGDNGGAILADTASTVSLTGASFENNNSYFGGAIADGSANTLKISRSSFESNGTSSTVGAAIAAQGTGGMDVTSSSFSANSALFGGAILWGADAPVSITHSTFDGNNANGYGGAIADGSSTSMTLSYDSFVNNSAPGTCFFLGLAAKRGEAPNLRQPRQGIGGCGPYTIGGGGALFLASTATSAAYAVDHDQFRGNNSSSGFGGAVVWGSGSLTSSASTYVDNNAGYEAGFNSAAPVGGGALFVAPGIYFFGGPGQGKTGSLTLINNTLSHNGGAGIAGGALDVYSPAPGDTISASLINNTITDNVAYPGYGGGIYGTANLTATGYSGPGTAGIENTVVADNNGGDCDAQFTTFDLGHNMDSDGSCFSTATQSTDKPNTEPGLGNPADNGGPLVGNSSDGPATTILTDAETKASPTVDAGTNTGCPSTDERGVARPQGASCDIGAFELAGAKLKVKKTAPKSVLVRSLFTYRITVSNSGPGYSTATTLVDKIPSGETLKDVIAPSGVTCSHKGRTVTCKIGVLRNGGSATVKIIVRAGRTGRIGNTAVARNAEGSKASGHASTKVGATKAARKRRAPSFTG